MQMKRDDNETHNTLMEFRGGIPRRGRTYDVPWIWQHLQEPCLSSPLMTAQLVKVDTHVATQQQGLRHQNFWI